jgi:hypothetical protein
VASRELNCPFAKKTSSPFPIALTRFKGNNVSSNARNVPLVGSSPETFTLASARACSLLFPENVVMATHHGIWRRREFSTTMSRLSLRCLPASLTWLKSCDPWSYLFLIFANRVKKAIIAVFSVRAEGAAFNARSARFSLRRDSACQESELLLNRWVTSATIGLALWRNEVLPGPVISLWSSKLQAPIPCALTRLNSAAYRKRGPLRSSRSASEVTTVSLVINSPLRSRPLK